MSVKKAFDVMQRAMQKVTEEAAKTDLPELEELATKRGIPEDQMLRFFFAACLGRMVAAGAAPEVIGAYAATGATIIKAGLDAAPAQPS